MGEPVVGWIEQGVVRKSARNLTVNAALAIFVMGWFGFLIYMMSPTVRGPAWQGFVWVGPALLGPALLTMAALSGLYTLGAWTCWRAVKECWGALHARLDGDDVILGNPFNLVPGKKKRFASGDTVKVSVASRTARGKPLSVWTIAGSGGTVVTNGPAPWTHAQWYELVEGLQRLGFTVVAEATPD